VLFSALTFLMMSVPKSSFGNGPVPFSPTVRVQRAAQDTGHGHEFSTISADSTWSPSAISVNPSRAMKHSLLIPGWGQIDNGKKKKAVLFFAAEIICIGGYIYNYQELSNEALTEWERENIRTDRNTFLLYWMLSKLLGMVDAYVDAHFADFDVTDITPKELAEPKNKR
jgi:hypothetical protein